MRGTRLAVLSMSAQPPAEPASVAGEAAALIRTCGVGCRSRFKPGCGFVRAASFRCPRAPPVLDPPTVEGLAANSVWG